MSAGPQKAARPRSRTFTHPFALLQGEGGCTRGPLLPVGPRAPYLQTPPCPLLLQTFEQQLAFVVQDEPDGKHPASVVVVVLVVTVVVVVGACVVVVLVEVVDVVVLVDVLVEVLLVVVGA
jgi:hypothetical protein